MIEILNAINDQEHKDEIFSKNETQAAEAK